MTLLQGAAWLIGSMLIVVTIIYLFTRRPDD